MRKVGLKGWTVLQSPGEVPKRNESDQALYSYRGISSLLPSYPGDISEIFVLFWEEFVGLFQVVVVHFCITAESPVEA